MSGGLRGDLAASLAPSSSSLKSKINLIQRKMSHKGKSQSCMESHGSIICENCRCHPISKLRLSRTVRRILAACMVSLVTLLGSVSIDLSDCVTDWRNTEEALLGLSSCTNLIAVRFIGFLQDQRALHCRENLNLTDGGALLLNNARSYCQDLVEKQDLKATCESSLNIRHTCAFHIQELLASLDNVTGDVAFAGFVSWTINEMLDELNTPDEDLKLATGNPDWKDVLSLHLLLRATETIRKIGCSAPPPSDPHQNLSYGILTMLNYAIYMSDTLYRCWVDLQSSGSWIYLMEIHKIPLFAPIVAYSLLRNQTMVRQLDSIRFCLYQRSYEKIKSKSKDILSTISLKVTLLAVTCLLYPIVLVSFKQMSEWIQDYAASLKERTEDLKKERKLAEDLLHQMLPKTVAKQLRKRKKVEAESYDQVTIFFSDIVGFTAISASCTPLQVVEMLNSLYICFDSRIESYNVYKVETIGDAYMVVSGLPERNNDRHADEIAKMALDLVAGVRQVIVPHMPSERLQLRAGIHTGPCVAGVVGYKMPRYCLFGDTVNTASRMESTSLPQKIHISSATFQVLLVDNAYEIEARGEIDVKGKGKMKTYWLIGNKNYSIQNDSLVCHWNPEIARRKKLELSLGSVQQSFSSNMLSESSRMNTPRIVEELSTDDAVMECQGTRAECSVPDTATPPRGRPLSVLQQNTERFISLQVPITVRTEQDMHSKDLLDKATALPGFVAEL
uniref:guanylate cyclase n=1 Tax=Leptobrachium leishanense TaxID=445787 RepID=A0A8C5QJV3_9ANUR